MPHDASTTWIVRFAGSFKILGVDTLFQKPPSQLIADLALSKTGQTSRPQVLELLNIGEHSHNVSRANKLCIIVVAPLAAERVVSRTAFAARVDRIMTDARRAAACIAASHADPMLGAAGRTHLPALPAGDHFYPL